MDPLDQNTFLTMVRSAREKAQARLLIDSLRAFGGRLGQSPVWVFEARPQEAPCQDLAGEGVQVLPLEVPGPARRNYFGPKVYACARAEQMSTGRARSLIWIDPMCLVIRPPLLFDLGADVDAAVRPVHIQNVGLTTKQPLDAFWGRVYETVGVEDVQTVVESFVDGRRLRAYFNSHAFAINPAAGLLGRWLAHFERLVGDEAFHAGLDDPHHIFLFQALLSALLATALAPERLRILPPDYNYPYNLQASVPPERRAQALNELTCIAYEDRSLDPQAMEDIAVQEPLASWLSARVGRAPS